MAKKAAALVRAEESIAATLAQADRIVTLDDPTGHAAQRELLRVLEDADKEVALRLLKVTRKPDGSMRFTEAQAISYRTQIQLVIERVKNRLDPLAVGTGDEAMKKSLAQGAHLLATLEKDFRGVTTSPNLLAAIQTSQVLKGPHANLVTQVATSVDRYGLQMGREFSHILQVGLVSGATTDQMIASLVLHGGPRGKVSLAAKETAPGVVERIREEDIPEGLFVRHRYWAERIVRTETAFAFNGAKLEQLYAMRREGLEVLKKICAHFDDRTAEDSVFVHGQVRALEATFLDGKGRVYLYPPGRPNDRETILPWFADWQDTPSTEPPSQAEQAEAKELAETPPGRTRAPLVPKSEASVRALEHEVQAEAQAQRQTAAGEHAAQTLTGRRDDGRAPDPADHDRETEAQKVLDRLRSERARKVVEIQKAAEAQRAREAREADQRTDRESKRLSKTIAVKLYSEEPYLAELELHAVAAERPRAFARYVNTRRPVVLPELSIMGAITGTTEGALEVKQLLIGDALGSYAADPRATLTVEALEAFKRSGLFFDEYLEKLSRARSLRLKRELAALLSSEGVPWAQASMLARTPDKAVARVRMLRARRGPV